jgi:hypothetical protein
MEDSKFESLWAIVGYLFSDRPRSALGGRPVKHAFKEIVRGICWILDTGAQWRTLPKEFPLWFPWLEGKAPLLRMDLLMLCLFAPKEPVGPLLRKSRFGAKFHFFV